MQRSRDIILGDYLCIMSHSLRVGTIQLLAQTKLGINSQGEDGNHGLTAQERTICYN